MAHVSVVETLFSRRRSNNLSIYSTAKDSDDLSFLEEHRIKIKFSVNASTSFGWHIKLVGSLKELGNWSVPEGLTLQTTPEKYPVWTSNTISLMVPQFPFTFEYKFVLCETSTTSVKWESFSTNRVVNCVDRCSRNYVFEIHDTLHKISHNELRVTNKTDFAEALSKLVKIKTLEEQLSGLSELLIKEVISYNSLALSCIAIKNMKNPLGNDYSAYVGFINWCSRNLSVQQTKILLSATSPTYIWLAVTNEELTKKINEYQEAYHEGCDDDHHLIALAGLRMALLSEYPSSDDIAGLLITDTYLERSEFILLERFIESLGPSDQWKIIMSGMWITQLLYLQCIKPKQTSILISQFERLRRNENSEVLRDLLFELLGLIFEVYSELYQKVNHQECEALAAVLMSEYKVLYNGIFAVGSYFMIKCIPILNKELGQGFFLPYSCGDCVGKVVFWKENFESGENCILVINCMPEELELPSCVKGIVVGYVDSLYHSTLIEGRKKGIPILVGNMGLMLSEDWHTMVVGEDNVMLEKINNLRVS